MDDLDFKDIYDFDFSELDHLNDGYFEDISDNEIIKEKLDEEQLKDFKDKVEAYLENLINERISESKYLLLNGYETVESVLQDMMNDLYGKDSFDEKIFEEFGGRRELFFDLSNAIIKEKTEEIKEEIQEEIEEKFYDEIDNRRGLDQRDLVNYIKNNEYNYHPTDDVDFIIKYLIKDGNDYTRKFISTEALDCIDPKLIQENDYLVREILECWIAPSKYLEGLDEDLGEERYSDEYKVYEDSSYGDLSEYYEEFYKKVMSQNQSAKNGEKFDDWAHHMMPTRLYKSEGSDVETLHNHEYAPSFIVDKLADADRFDKIGDFLDGLEDDLDESDILSWIFALENLTDNPYILSKQIIDKVEEYIVPLVEEAAKAGYKYDFLWSRYRTDFLIKSYIKSGKEIPDELKQMSTEEKIERIKKEVELEKLQEEDQKCDEALELAGKIYKTQENEQDGHDSNDDGTK